MRAYSKIRYSIIVVAAAAGMLFVAGCSKHEQPAADATQPMTSGTSDAPKPAETSNPTTEAAPQAAAGAATDQASASVAATSSQAQTLIEKAKGLVTDQKYEDALTVVQQLSGIPLTPEQRHLVNGLRVQIRGVLGAKAVPDASPRFGTKVDHQSHTQE
jgi:hypothetical protein